MAIHLPTRSNDLGFATSVVDAFQWIGQCIADEAIWVGKHVGDFVDFGGLLGRAPIVPVNTRSSQRLIARGGRIPSPLQALIYLIPLGLGWYVARTATIVDSTGLTARAMLGSRSSLRHRWGFI